MSNKYFSGRKGHYIFCDICGQACYDWEVTKLSTLSGRPGLLVCPRDADVIDHGLIPYTPTTEQPIKWSRINHSNITNGESPLDYDTATNLGT